MEKDYLLSMVKFLLPTEAEEDSREQSALRLASLGWSLPVLFSHCQIVEAAKAVYTPEQVNEVIVQFYVDNDFLILKKLVLETIFKADDIDPWRKTIEQCYDSFIQGKYLVVVPTLITVIEGYLSQKIGTMTSANVRMMGPTKSKAIEPKAHRLDKTIWLSVSVIIDTLYQPSDFSGNEPSTLNRHWILHGRSSPMDSKTDSVKLFNLLGSLSIA
jgi:hypothetical protein